MLIEQENILDIVVESRGSELRITQDGEGLNDEPDEIIVDRTGAENLIAELRKFVSGQ